MDKFRDKVDFDLSHPDWVREIEDTLKIECIQHLKPIYEFIGALSVLVFVRLFKRHKLLKMETKDFPKNTAQFLTYAAQSFMNLVDEPNKQLQKNLKT